MTFKQLLPAELEIHRPGQAPQVADPLGLSSDGALGHAEQLAELIGAECGF
jgi:hypothetical protein